MIPRGVQCVIVVHSGRVIRGVPPVLMVQTEQHPHLSILSCLVIFSEESLPKKLTKNISQIAKRKIRTLKTQTNTTRLSSFISSFGQPFLEV